MMEKPVCYRFLDRFRLKYRVTPGCWIWEAAKFANGYGSIRLNGKYVKAHRVAYALWVEAFPDHLCVLHKCDNPACINPDHLVLGTHADNMADMSQKGRSAHGQRSGATVLTSKEIWQIRDLYASGLFTTRELGKIYGVGNQAISRYASFARHSRDPNPYNKEFNHE